MTTSLRDLIDAASANGSAVPPEVAAFVALEVAERLSARPTRVAPVFIEVSGEGEISVASTAAVSATDAVRGIGRLLGEMVAGEGGVVPPGLEEVVRRSSNGGAEGYADLDALLRDLEAYLVPLNRGAARRVLARYLWDVVRAPTETVPSGPVPRDDATQDAIDLVEEVQEAGPAPRAASRLEMPPRSDVDALLDDLDPQRVTVPVQDVGSILDELEPADEGTDSQLDSLLQDVPTYPRIDPLPSEERPVVPISVPAPAVAAPVAVTIDAPARQGPTGVTAQKPILLPDTSEIRPRRGFGLLLVTVLLLLVALGVVLYRARPDLFGAAPATAAEASRAGLAASAGPAARAQYGTMTVTSEPTGAEVLLFVGRGPVEVTHLPVGVAHEFVAISDDGRVARAVVPADSPFQPRRDGPDPVATELAIQLPQVEEASRAPWPGTNLPPGGPAEGTGQLGTVRVVTNPIGAKVFLLVGFTPTAPISNLRIDDAYELVVVKDGHARERVVIGRSDWTREEGGDDFAHQATVTLRAEDPQPEKSERPRRRRRRR